jgi:PAS domain S-box-containing protein
MLDLPPGAVIGQPLDTVMPRAAADLFRTYLAAATRSQAAVSWEVCEEGRTLHHTLSPVGDGHGGVARLILSALDVTKQESSERALGDSHRQLETILAAAPSTIITFDALGRVTSWNQAAERTFGWSERDAVGRCVSELFPTSANEQPTCLQAALTGETVAGAEVTCRRSDGSDIELLISTAPLRDVGGAVVGGVAIAADVSGRNRLQAHLLQAQKMDAAAQVAGGVARGLANLLQALMSGVELLKLRACEPARVLAVAEKIELQIQQGVALTAKLELFSHKAAVRHEPTDLNQMLSELAPLLRTLLRENIAIELDLGPGILPVEADTDQLRQALVNLALNSADAMADGGCLTLATGLSDPDRVWLEVRDNGIGVACELTERVFEPFFTTKDPLQHTGLGLAVVHGVVIEHGGTVGLSSVPGEGTSVRIELPRTTAEPAAPRPLRGGFADIVPGHGERVLVIEDEEGARQGLWDVLGLLGYRVVAVGSGDEAGLLPQSSHFDALLTDYMLPDATGPQLVQGLCERWPGLRVIVMSSYSEDEVRHQPEFGDTMSFLQKPFDMGTLARKLRLALDTPAPSSAPVLQ